MESRLHVQVGTQKFGRRTEGRTSENNLPYNAMQSILDETISIGRTNEWDLQLRDVKLRLYCRSLSEPSTIHVDKLQEGWSAMSTIVKPRGERLGGG